MPNNKHPRLISGFKRGFDLWNPTNNTPVQSSVINCHSPKLYTTRRKTKNKDIF